MASLADSVDVSRRHVRRIVAGGSAVVSAGASSLTGLLVNVAAATTLDAGDFGHFSFIYVVVLTIMTLLRAICGEVVLFTDSTPVMTGARRNSTVTVASLAISGVLVLVLLGAVLDPVGYFAAAALVPVCVQDNYRYLAFAAGRTGTAAWSDVVTALGPLAIVAFGRDSSNAGNAAFAAWGATALAGAVLAELMMRPGHGFRPAASFAPALRPLRHAALIEYASTALLYQAPLLFLPLVVSYADVGAMRGLQMVFAPVTILHAAMFALVIPRLTKDFEERGDISYGFLMAYVAVLTTLTLLIAIVLSNIPDDWAGRVLGDTSDAVQANAWAYLCAQLAAIAASAATIARRIDRTYGAVARVRLLSALSAPVLCLAGAAAFGVSGACLALAASQGLYLFLLRSPFVTTVRAHSL